MSSDEDSKELGKAKAQSRNLYGIFCTGYKFTAKANFNIF